MKTWLFSFELPDGSDYAPITAASFADAVRELRSIFAESGPRLRILNVMVLA